MLKDKKRSKKKLPRWSKVLFLVAAVAAIVLLVSVLSEGFANFFNRTVSAFFRAVLAYMTSWLPFSLVEILVYCIPLFIVVITVIGSKYHCDSWSSFFRYLGCIVSVFSMFFTLFVFSFGVGYHTSSLDERLDIERVEVDAASLKATAEKLVETLNLLCNEITYGEDGFSHMPYSQKEMSDAIVAAYEPVSERYPFIQNMRSRIKPVLASRAMSYTHITGVYTYFTGEANLNTHFPPYARVFTAAHELAHQRGIARENEANFVAFLVCNGAEDVYLRYCAQLNMLEYILNALYSADAEAYVAVLETLDSRVLEEMRAFSRFFAPYRDSAASGVSDAVNDFYLKLNGNKAGSDSYGLVVELTVAYYAQ